MLNRLSELNKTWSATRAAAHTANAHRPRPVLANHSPARAPPAAVQSLLHSLCREIAARYEISEPVPASTEDLVGAFPRFCTRATRARPLIVLLDALDQLSDADR